MNRILGLGRAALAGLVTAAGLASAAGGQPEVTVTGIPNGLMPGTGNSPGLRAKILGGGAKLAGYAACVIPQPGISLSPPTMSFGSLASGNTSSPQNLTIFNPGNKELVVSSILVDRGGLDSASTYQVGGSCSSVMPGSSCSVPIAFVANHPSALSVPATLRVFSNAPGSPHAISLSGNVTVGPPPPAPVINVSPSVTLSLGNILLGNTSGTSTVTVSNSGTAPLLLTSVSSTNSEFSVLPSGAPSCLGGSVSVPAGQSCQFGVNFTPSSTGSRSGSIELSHSPAPINNFTNVSVAGFGVATLPTLEVLPSNLYWNIQAGTHEDQTVTVKNISAVNVNVSSVTTSGLGFSVQAEDCVANSPLTPGETCTIDVRASFGASDGYGGTLTIGNDTAVNPLTVSLYADVFPKPPEYTITPSSIDFGTFTVGVSSPVIMDLTVTNTSTTDTLTFTASTAVGSNFFIHAPTAGTPCGSPVAPGQTCTIGVLFQAFTEDFFDDYVTVFESNYGNSLDVYVSGNGFVPGPRISSSTTSHSFGSQVLGTSSTQTFTITNTGQAISTPTLDFFDIYISGSSDFSIENTTCNISMGLTNEYLPNAKAGVAKNIAPSTTCTITVKYMPTSPGSHTAAVVIDSNALNSPELYIYLDGTGTSAPEPSVDFVPMSLSFAAQPLCSTSTGKAVSFANTGAAPLNILSVVSTGEFVSANDCPATLAPGACCTIGVTYTPAPGGTGTGSLTVTHDAPGGPTVIPLTGTTDGALVCVNPAQLAFPDTRVGTFSTTQILTISNPSSSAPVSISGITASADFKAAQPTGPTTLATAPNCVGILAPSASCNLQVGFTPTSGPGAKTGSIMVSTTTGSPKSVPVTGNATPATAPGVSLSATSLRFSGQVINTESAASVLNVNSSGTQVLDITGVNVTGPFRVENKCPASVSVGDSCPLNVFFKPPTVGPHTGTLTLATNAANSPHVVNLAGDGVPVPAPNLVLSASSLSFGTVLVGTRSAAQPLTLTNRGNAPLLLGTIQSTNGFISSVDCPASLAANASCNVNVLFQAFGFGTQTGTITIQSNDAKSPHSASLNGKSCPIPSSRAARLGLGAC